MTRACKHGRGPERSAPVLRGALAVFAAAWACAALAAEPIEKFGPHWIERAPGKNSYILRLAGEDGTGLIALRCLADEQAITVQVGAPNGSGGIAPRQTVTVWSDKTPAVDVVVNGDPTGRFGIAVMNESAGVEPDAAFTTLFETVVTAEQHISYSVGTESVTLDATHLQAARARFGALCARPADEPPRR